MRAACVANEMTGAIDFPICNAGAMADVNPPIFKSPFLFM
jgi:hypothetical protein